MSSWHTQELHFHIYRHTVLYVWLVFKSATRLQMTTNYMNNHNWLFQHHSLLQVTNSPQRWYSTFETWWHTRRNQIWSFRETDESI